MAVCRLSLVMLMVWSPLVHLSGLSGLHPWSRSVRYVAAAGPAAVFHVGLSLANLNHSFLVASLWALSEVFQSSNHKAIWRVGIRTAGSAAALSCHLIVVVVQGLVPGFGIQLIAVVLNCLMVVGVVPLIVDSYSCCGTVPVS